MVTITALLLPILISAIVVWLASFVVWTVLPHHKSDFSGLPDEEAVVKALRPQNLAPGQYNIPHVESREALKQPEVQKRFEEGPNAFLTVLPKGMPAMGKNLVLTFLFYIAVGVVVAYLAGRTLPPGANYLQVFRVAGTVAWLAYGFATVQDGIWFGRPWSAVAKQLADGLLYALLTAGVFGWLWPA